jgi:NhaA family Na+:H+ antiporter
MSYGDVAVVGLAAGIGFTVALFFATAAFPAGRVLDEAKMGALLSLLAAPLAVAGSSYRRRRRRPA